MRWKRGNRLRLIGEDEASPAIKAIFGELRDSLGVSSVPLLYQAYAAFPQFLEIHWRAFRPMFRSRQFFQLGSRLGAESYTRVHAYLSIEGLTACDTTPRTTSALSLTQVLDYFQYLDPLLLLICSAQMQAFEGSIGRSEAIEGAQPLSFRTGPDLLQDEEATPPVQRIWMERRRLLEVALFAEEHRALARWPEFYLAYWSSLKASVGSPLYSDCQYRIGESALRLVHELPARIETSAVQLLEAGMDAEELSSVVRINEAFMQAMTGLLLDVTVARIACDGGTPHQSQAEERSSGAQAKKKKSTSKAA